MPIPRMSNQLFLSDFLLELMKKCDKIEKFEKEDRKICFWNADIKIEL